MKCANCNLTCHDKCKSKVQLNCTAFERPKSPGSNSQTNSSSSSSSSSSIENLETLAGISTIIDEEIEENGGEENDEGTLKNIDLISAFNDSTSDDVSSLMTDDETTLHASAIDDSLISSEELQSAIMLYNDRFPSGQETVVENGKIDSFTFLVCVNIMKPKLLITEGTRFQRTTALGTLVQNEIFSFRNYFDTFMTSR